MQGQCPCVCVLWVCLSGRELHSRFTGFEERGGLSYFCSYCSPRISHSNLDSGARGLLACSASLVSPPLLLLCDPCVRLSFTLVDVGALASRLRLSRRRFVKAPSVRHAIRKAHWRRVHHNVRYSGILHGRAALIWRYNSRCDFPLQQRYPAVVLRYSK